MTIDEAVRDITKAHNTKSKVREILNQLVESVIDSIPNLICSIDADDTTKGKWVKEQLKYHYLTKE